MASDATVCVGPGRICIFCERPLPERGSQPCPARIAALANDTTMLHHP